MYIELMLFFFLGLAWFCLFYIVDNIVLIINFKHFDFSEWFFSNSNSNGFFERSSINDFLVDCLMCMCTRFITLLMLKSPASGLILINLQLRFFLYHNIFCLHNHINQFLLQVCIQESKDQVFCLKCSIEYS